MKHRVVTTRRQFFAALAAAGGAAALAGCSGAGSGSSQAAEGTLTIGIQDEPEGLDIQQITWENYVHWLIYEPLLNYSDDLSQVSPAFAESFEASEDGLTYTIVLPEDAKFSNGDALDANAYKASLDRYLEISPYSSDYADVASVEVPDNRTLVFHMSVPAPYFITPLSNTYSGIVDVAAITDDAEFNRAPVANGPYVVENWEQGSQITFVKNENYKTQNEFVENKGAFAFDKIVIRFIPDEFTRVSEVESGGVDLIFDVPTSSYAELEGNEDVQLFDYEQAGVSYLYMQTESGPLADIAVRQAITYAIDRDEIQSTLDGLVTPTYGYISSAQACYSAEEEEKLAGELAFDPDRARKALADAGWSDSDGDGIVEKDGEPLSFEMLIPSDRASLKNAAPVIQQQLKNVGIDAQIVEQEAAYIKASMEANDFTMGSRNFVWLDPDILYSVFTPSSGYPWEDAEITEALTVARQTANNEERIAAYANFQDLLATRFKAISLFADKYAIAAKNIITGVHVTNDGRLFLADAGVQE